MKTYSIKDVQAITGSSLRTIKTYLKKLYPQSCTGRGVAVRFTEDQFIKMVDCLPKRNIVEIGKNAQKEVQNCTTKGSNDTSRLDRIEDVGEKLLKVAQALIDDRIQNSSDNITVENTVKSLPLPPLADRAALNKAVQQKASDLNLEVATIWGNLYSELYYRNNINVRVKAKNSGRSNIEVIEEANLMGSSIAIVENIGG
jgi:hypothetical protein